MWYMLLIVWNLYKKARPYESAHCLGLILGLVCCMVAAITNPALASFDRLIPIYFGIGALA